MEEKSSISSIEECAAFYATLKPEIKAPALALLARELKEDSEAIAVVYKANPAYWWTSYHFYWGMGIRNLLRLHGFGENYFKVDNLDDIYIALVEEALELKSDLQ